MKRLIAEGILEAQGNTKGRRYSLKLISKELFDIPLSIGLAEDVVWRFRILPHIKNVRQNVVDICQYGFTEMLNNAIDHSVSDKALISYEQTYNKIIIHIMDYGVGIFDKIQKDFGLPDARSALLELAKGKLTSDRKNHSGEGIFFTSRMFDEYSLRSGFLFYTRTRQDDDEWLIETEDKPVYNVGTSVMMEIATNTERTKRDVFDKYQKDGDVVLAFRKTHVPLKLSKYPNEQLVSRSQAKRVLSRFDDFTEVLLDFDGVKEIGQGFADEIFRVFKNQHPDISLIAIRTTPEIDKMIRHVQSAEPTTPETIKNSEN
jgi:anti-sigma regulatory factor (Ser/Thr protein kinase)